jgi:4-alpha-glucanotransferase
LSELAQINGVQLGYTGNGGRRIKSPTDSLLAVLGALGHPVSDSASIERELAESRRQRDERVVEPVVVQRPGGRLSAPILLDAGLDPADCWLGVQREDGSADRRRLADVAVPSEVAASGSDRAAVALDLSGLGLPTGYHRLTVEHPKASAEALLLAPPPRLPAASRGFGVFAPIYGLRGSDDWGVGSLRDLATFADLVGGWGGDLVGTLPLFPSFFRAPVDPSPYLPVSRRFWNELYVDVDALPELALSPAARSLVGSPAFQSDLAALRAEPLVDYGAVMAAKRSVMLHCAQALVEQPGPRREEFEGFVKSHPDLEPYADFRAAEERLGSPWRQWRDGEPDTAANHADASAVLYHRYAQFAASEQIVAAADRSGGTRAGLYLDLPVGVHPDGYDTWASPELFAPAGVGAPPDAFFAGGQSWGFPPLHPERIRDSGYRYVIDAYRHVLQHSRAVRIDHVLGLQRLFWIPDGCGPEAGAYVRYHTDELRAVVAIEASRTNTVVVGEDLGTVSAGIRQAMDRDGMLHSFVYQFAASGSEPFPQPRKPSVASLGSHDLPRFAAFWRGTDIEERLTGRLIDDSAAAHDHAERDALVTAVMATWREPTDRTERNSDASVRAGLRTALQSLAEGPATYVLADLADLELEVVPDNRPGTGPEADNWRRRLPRPLAEVGADARIVGLLTDLQARRSTDHPEGAGT